ncbi:MAG TPA: class I SAM-dependent methyltransferase [Bryobacteraceae bacterium]|jgi:predicted O-methyltransferase YrrM
MKRISTLIAIVLITVTGISGQRRGSENTAPEKAQSPPLGQTASEKRILTTINDVVRSGAVYANVPVADGRMLCLLTEAANAKNVIEIGTSTGISGLWFSMALEKTGGRLTTFELDPQRAALARTHFKQAGVDQTVTIVEGDAHKNVAKLSGPVDLVFIDADKAGYVDYLKKVLPLVRPGGLILAHNIDMTPEYMKAVTGDPALETVVYTQGNQLAITLKKR